MGRWVLEGSFCGMFGGGGGAYDGGCDNGDDDDDDGCDDGCNDEEDDEGDDDDNYNDGGLDIYATCEQRRCRDSSKVTRDGMLQLYSAALTRPFLCTCFMFACPLAVATAGVHVWRRMLGWV